MSKVTIYSIAEELNISASTVSRAFSRPELVKADVRSQILSLAERLGYQPNKAARRLVTGKTGAIGLFVPDITNPFMPPLVRAIQQAAVERDASVLLVDAEEDSRAEPGLISRVAGQVDGLIIVSPRSASQAIKQAIGGKPAVLANRVMEGVPSVVCDNTVALRAAGDHLTGLGHRTIALLRGPSASWAAQRRTEAVRSWARRSDVELIELGPVDASFEGGREGAAALAESAATAVFAFDDLAACGVVAGLADRGLRVPRDRSVIGCDDVLLARVLTPSLTTITAPVDDLGLTAVRMLEEAIAGRTPESVRLPGSFVPRDSTGPATTP
ncbi:MAG TPA: LacI family DNA-binding transcriptional regulator [Microlunatus sp.]|nr:LacI family DNA-binding transcriptional regulator [Microlunatus sp.]